MPKRHRSNDELMTKPYPHEIYWTYNNGANSAIWGQWSGFRNLFPLPKNISIMDDVVGEQGSFNPVTHFVLDSFIENLSPWKDHSGNQRGLLFKGVPFPLISTFGVPGSFSEWPWLPSISSATLSDWSIEAYNKFNEQVPTTVSLPNFMYELREMKGMIPSIDRSSLSKTASNNFLAFEFGVKPFVADIKAIINMSDSVAKRIQHLLKQQGKTSRLSFNRTTVFDTPYTMIKSLYIPNNSTPSGNDVYFRRLNAKSEFHCGASLFQDLKDLEDSMATMKALAASGGFSHPARVIWNAIPYSFVVDWFFHVGKLLDSLIVQPFGGTYKVSDVGYSIKTEAVYYATQVFTESGYSSSIEDLGTVKARSYIRRPGFPATSLFLTNGELTPMQLALSAAMLNQRRR